MSLYNIHKGIYFSFITHCSAGSREGPDEIFTVFVVHLVRDGQHAEVEHWAGVDELQAPHVPDAVLRLHLRLVVGEGRGRQDAAYFKMQLILQLFHSTYH